MTRFECAALIFLTAVSGFQFSSTKLLAASKPRVPRTDPAKTKTPDPKTSSPAPVPPPVVETTQAPPVGTYRSQKLLFPVFGLTGSSGYGPPRFGPDVSLLIGQCVDACGGLGITGGLFNLERSEYYVGAALGVAYMGSFWLEAAVHVRDQRASGMHASFAMGWFVMPFIELGADFERGTPTARAGLTVKAPLGRIGR